MKQYMFFNNGKYIFTSQKPLFQVAQLLIALRETTGERWEVKEASQKMMTK